MEGVDIKWLLETTDRLRGIPSADYPLPQDVPVELIQQTKAEENN